MEWKCVECFTGKEYTKVHKSPTPYAFSLVVSGYMKRDRKTERGRDRDRKRERESD